MAAEEPARLTISLVGMLNHSKVSLNVVKDWLGDLRAAGIIEKDDRALQGREFRVDRWKIEGHSNSFNSMGILIVRRYSSNYTCR